MTATKYGIFLFVLALLFCFGSRADEKGQPPSVPAEAQKVAAPDTKAKEQNVVKEPIADPEATALKNQMQELFELSKKIDSKVPSERSKARKSIEDAMDWDQVARMCLGNKEWNKQSTTNRSTFRDLLKDVIKLTAYGRLAAFWAEVKSYTFKDIKITGKKAHLTSEFAVKDEMYVLDYFMDRKGNRWIMTDISYEGMKYSENINEQVTEFLKENSFAKLVEKLRKRKADLEEEEKSPKPAKGSPKKG